MLGNLALTYSLTSSPTRRSGLFRDLTRWPIPGMSLFCLRMMSTNSRGLRPLSKALVNSSAAPSRAPPNREPMCKETG